MSADRLRVVPAGAVARGAPSGAIAPAARAGRRPARPAANWAAVGLCEPTPRPALVTVDEVVADYLAGDSFAHLSVGARRKNARNCAFFAAVFGGWPMRDLDAPSVAHWLRGAPGRSARRDWKGTVGVLWRHAVAVGAAAGESPAKAVPWPDNPPRTRYVTDEELRHFAAGAEPRLRAYLALKLCTGLRRGQLWGLCWANWDADRGVLAVAAAKSGFATRYTGAAVVEAVRAVRGVFGGGAGAVRVFRKRNGAPFAEPKHMLRVEWDRARRLFLASGGVNFHEHDLRAKVATDVSDLRRAQMLLGHTSQRMTEHVYRRMGREVESVESSLQAITRERSTSGLCQLDLFATPPPPAERPESAPRRRAAPAAPKYPHMGARYLAGATVTELALRYGVSKSTVSWHIRRLGIGRGRGGMALPLDAAVRRYLAGESATAIAADAKVSPTTLRAKLAAAGVEIRPRGKHRRCPAAAGSG